MADLSEFMGTLILLLPMLQYVAFFLFTLAFGRIALVGWRTQSPWYARVVLLFAFGAFSLFCGIALSGTAVPGDGGVQTLLRLLMLDVFLAGLLSSVLVAAGALLISLNVYNPAGIKAAIRRLEGKLRKAESARSPVTVTLVAGIFLLAALAVFSLMNYRGVPSYTDRLSEAIGIPVGQLQEILGVAEGAGIASAPEGCAGILGLLQANSGALLDGSLPEYVDPQVQSMIESGAGSGVMAMYRVQYGGEDYVLAFTQSRKVCSAKPGRFCQCVDVGALTGNI
jgi:hypothetical protein